MVRYKEKETERTFDVSKQGPGILINTKYEGS